MTDDFWMDLALQHDFQILYDLHEQCLLAVLVENMAHHLERGMDDETLLARRSTGLDLGDVVLVSYAFAERTFETS
jgi:hypothetical protein